MVVVVTGHLNPSGLTGQICFSKSEDPPDELGAVLGENHLCSSLPSPLNPVQKVPPQPPGQMDLVACTLVLTVSSLPEDQLWWELLNSRKCLLTSKMEFSKQAPKQPRLGCCML